MSDTTQAQTTPLPEDFPWTESTLDAFFRQYLETALWSTTDESDETGGEPLDANYDIEDIPIDVRERLRAECVDFITANAADLEFWTATWGFREGAEQAGHDFWLTRNNHGTGFWDRFSPNTSSYRAGERLSEASHVWGGIDLYVDNGVIWASGYEGDGGGWSPPISHRTPTA